MTEATAQQVKPILEMRNITKVFPGVVALKDVSFNCIPGEVHAVVGENGAGKSTLMKIMVGAYTPDEGEIIFQGEAVYFAHPAEAQMKGLSIVYQEFNLLPERTVAQNIFLGREPSKFGVVDIHRLNQDAGEVLKEMGVETLISPTSMVSSLSVAEQQLVEIAKAISLHAKVLVMDEPTAALTNIEVKMLDDLINRLKTSGIAIVFISHRLKEVFDLADRITVLKDGQFINTVKTSEVKISDIIFMMVGRELDHYFPPLGAKEDLGDVVLKVKDGANNFLSDINFELRKGEVLGIAGLQGSGRTELAQAVFGVVPFKTGSLELRGKNTHLKAPSQAISQKMGFVTEDRKSEGLLPKQPIRDNILLTIRSRLPALVRIYKDGVRKKPDLVPSLGKQVDVRVDTYDKEVQLLSGGNQQKVILAKWLASDADIFIFDEPTRGIDVEAKASIHDMIRDLTKKGAAVMMISSELPEIIGMSDRILVMWDGRIAGELPAKSTEQEIMLVATGHGKKNTESAAMTPGKE
jgi:ribose transport system ATP-binding protein